MPEERELEKQLKLASKTGKYVVGRREVMSGIKGSKFLIWSASAGLPQSILDESRNLQIPAIKFNGNPVELGRACGIPFRVSVIAIKSTGDADLGAFASSADYLVSSSPSLPGFASSTVQVAGAAEQKSEQEEKEEDEEEGGGGKKVTHKKRKPSPAKEKLETPSKKRKTADKEEKAAEEEETGSESKKADKKKSSKKSKKKKESEAEEDEE